MPSGKKQIGWQHAALAACRKGDEFRSAGNTADAQKFDNLANVALQRQMTAVKLATDAAPGLGAQNEVVDKLKGGLDHMRGKLHELTAKRNEKLVARSRTAAAQSQVHDALKSLGAGDPTSRSAGTRRASVARRPQSAASRNSPPHRWKPSSPPWKTSASSLKWRHGSPR